MSWLKDYFSGWLSDFLGDEGPQYCDLDYAVSTVQQGKVEWQAVASIAFRIALLNLDSKSTDAERTLAQRIADSILEPLEELIQCVVDEPDENASQENRARALFHARFAMGELYIVKDDTDRGIDILAQVVTTKPTVEVHRVKSSDGVYEEHTFIEGPERVSDTVDIIFGKTLASYEMAPRLINRGDYGRALYLLAEAARNFPFIVTLRLISLWVDAWTDKCIESNNLEHWVSLIDTLAEIAGICDREEEIEQLGSSPSKCEVTSANYWAWKFGQIVGKLHIYKKANVVETLMEDYYPSLMEWENGLACVSLWSECDDKRDWEMAQLFYLEMWERTANHYGPWLFEEGADSGLYWAMRVGIADAFLECKMSAEKFAGTMQPQVLTDITEIFDKVLPKEQATDSVITNAIRDVVDQKISEAIDKINIDEKTRDEKLKEDTKERLRRDYFRRLWGVLETETRRELLISVEVAWIRQDLGLMANKMRKVLEVELPVIFSFLEPTLKQTNGRLILTRMRDELRTNRVVRASINGLRMDVGDKEWVKNELPHFLQKVIDVRNYFDKDEHLPSKGSYRNRDMTDMAESIHDELFGVGAEGILPRLMGIKKII